MPKDKTIEEVMKLFNKKADDMVDEGGFIGEWGALDQKSIENFLRTALSAQKEAVEKMSYSDGHDAGFDEGFYKGKKSAEKETREKVGREINEALEKEESAYPEDIFPEPWNGWQKDVHALAQEKGQSIDRISAHYSRWQEKLQRKNAQSIVSAITHNKEK